MKIGDVLVVEPGEAHTFTQSSPDTRLKRGCHNVIAKLHEVRASEVTLIKWEHPIGGDERLRMSRCDTLKSLWYDYLHFVLQSPFVKGDKVV